MFKSVLGRDMLIASLTPGGPLPYSIHLLDKSTMVDFIIKVFHLI